MKLEIHDLNGEVTGEIEVNEKVFGAEVKPHLFWEVVRWQQAKKRAGTHSVLTRHGVKGTTQKVYRQKGTGNARHGSKKAPVYVGGGVAHGPHPRNYGFKVNKKVRAGALRSALSMKIVESRLKVVESFELAQPKTKDAKAALERLGAGKALVVDNTNEGLNRSLRNLEGCKYLNVAGLNVYDLLRYDTVILTKSALESAQERLSR
jgi:large subunit ribosomal protein L4